MDELRLAQLNSVPARGDGSCGRLTLRSMTPRPGDKAFPMLVERYLRQGRIDERRAEVLLEKHALVAYDWRAANGELPPRVGTRRPKLEPRGSADGRS